MVKINVIDLDGTLIEFDSMKLYIKKFLTTKYFFAIIYFSILRKTRFLDRATFFFRVLTVCRKHSDYQKIMAEISTEVVKALKKDILNEIKEYTDTETINVLCTASPFDYTEQIAKYLKWQLISSHCSKSEKIHMYGNQKKITILQMYPKNLYHYNYAVADSESDMSLLEMFVFSKKIDS